MKVSIIALVLLAACADHPHVARTQDVNLGGGESGTASLARLNPRDMVDAPGVNCGSSEGSC